MNDQITAQAVVVDQASPNQDQTMMQLAFFTAGGAARVIPSEAEARADAAALTSAAATGGEPPTEAEYNALRTDVSNLRTAFNDLLAKLRAANVIST